MSADPKQDEPRRGAEARHRERSSVDPGRLRDADLSERRESEDAVVRALDTRPLRAASLTTQAYDRLRRAITERDLADGSPLVIAKLVRLFGISQTPIREAMARLHSEGLLSFVDNVGYRVARRPSESDLRAWMEARLPLEVACVRLAAARITDEEIVALRGINARIGDEARGSDFESVRLFADLNAAFHRVVSVASRNPYLRRAHEQIWLGAHFSRGRFRRPTDYQEIIAEHDAVVAALARADGEAAGAAMERHIVDSLDRDRQGHAAELRSPSGPMPPAGRPSGARR